MPVRRDSETAGSRTQIRTSRVPSKIEIDGGDFLSWPVLNQTMKICYFDAFSGISGDMTVGALCDAGRSVCDVQAVLTSLNFGATFRLEKTKRKGIAASKFTSKAASRKRTGICRTLKRSSLARSWANA